MTSAAIRDPPVSVSVPAAAGASTRAPASGLQSAGAVARSGGAATVAQAPQTSVAKAPAQPLLDAGAMVRLSATLHASERFAAAATALATELAAVTGAERVCLGFADGDYCEVAAVSGAADFEARADIFRAIAAAMDEAVEQGATLAHPARPGDRPRATLAQAELARRGHGHVCTVPLVNRSRAIGAMTFEYRHPGAPGLQQRAWCEILACTLAPALELRRNASEGWWRRLCRAWRGAGDASGRSGRWSAMLLTLAGLIVLILLCTWPVGYRVSAPVRLEGAIQRALVAPADGFLQQVHVKPGDAVKAGQVVAELADQDLAVERRKWAAELTQHDNTARAALARAERTQYVVAQGRAAEVRAQLDLVEQQLTRGRIRAPFDGIVIKGDLTQMLGSPVQRGDVLVTVAPARQFRLIIEVDERDIRDVRLGAAGVVALAALPGETGAFRVVRITPVTTSREGRNFYEVEAGLEGADAAWSPGLRPGLQGVGKIHSEDRTLAWIWGHRLFDWARLALWSLGG